MSGARYNLIFFGDICRSFVCATQICLKFIVKLPSLSAFVS